MKTIFIFTLLLNLISFSAYSQSQKSEIIKQKKSALTIPKGRLSTDVRFDDHMVNGKYQNSFEAVSTVENDKDLDDLIGIRMNFRDRLKKSESMR